MAYIPQILTLSYLFLVGATVFAAGPESGLRFSGDTATELQAALSAQPGGLSRSERGLVSSNGGVAFECKGTEIAGSCALLTDALPLHWDDDADGTPYSVEQISLYGKAAEEFGRSLRSGTPVEPIPTVTGGSDPVLEIRTFGSADASLFIQCELRRIYSNCVVQRFTF